MVTLGRQCVAFAIHRTILYLAELLDQQRTPARDTFRVDGTARKVQSLDGESWIGIQLLQDGGITISQLWVGVVGQILPGEESVEGEIKAA